MQDLLFRRFVKQEQDSNPSSSPCRQAALLAS
jgi:hypothetical protein